MAKTGYRLLADDSLMQSTMRVQKRALHGTATCHDPTDKVADVLTASLEDVHVKPQWILMVKLVALLGLQGIAARAGNKD